MTSVAVRSFVVAAVVAFFAYGCGSSAPSDHTVNEGGVMHKPGLQAPLTNCVSCHGSSLQGGAGPSCTSCHGVKW